MDQLGLFLFMLIGFINGITISFYILLRSNTSIISKWVSLSVLLFSLAVIREFSHFFDNEIGIRSVLSDLFYFKLFIPGILILAFYNNKALRNKKKFLIPGSIVFIVMLLYTLIGVFKINFIEDVLPIVVDCLSFLWLFSFYLKNKASLEKERKLQVFFRGFTVALGIVFFTRLIQLVAVLIHSNKLYSLHFTFRMISLSVIVYILSIALINHFLKTKKKAFNMRDVKNNLDLEILDRIKEDKKYLELNLTLERLAALYQLDSKRLSNSIRIIEKVSFNDFINRLRIEHFMELLKGSEFEKKTIFGLAQNSGFNSKATFNRVFKKHFDCTPSQYISTHFSYKNAKD